MQQKYNVLIGKSMASSRDAFGGTAAAMPSLMGTSPWSAAPVMSEYHTKEYSIVSEEMKREQFDDLRRDPTVIGLAPEMPIILVKPMKTKKKGKSPKPASIKSDWGIAAVGADKSPYTGAGVKVAVLDTGINKEHPAFDGVNIVEEDFTGSGNGDGNGHGTHCAGTIFGQDVNGIRIGVARGIDKALIGKVLDEKGGGSTSGILKAIEWALNGGANIISMSLGMDYAGYVGSLKQWGMPEPVAVSKALADYRANLKLFEAISATIKAKEYLNGPCLIIAAAGNESRRDLNKEFEIAAMPPSVAEGILAIGALGRTATGLFETAYFSNTGADVSAPGVDILSANYKTNGLTTMSGTSMATPYTAGVAALWGEQAGLSAGLTSSLWEAKLLGLASRSGFVKSADFFDIGAGMVQAPMQ